MNDVPAPPSGISAEGSLPNPAGAATPADGSLPATAGLAEVIVVSGMSGAGKSVAMRALEDAGWYCTDNLPVSTIIGLVVTLRASGVTRIALSTDARNRVKLDDLPDVLTILRNEGLLVREVFLDASTEELVRRFRETRRPHPFSSQGLSLDESIAVERDMLASFAERAYSIDTTSLRPNALRAEIKAFASAEPERLHLFVYSFGFKYGIPVEADFVFDARFLPNPYYDPALRPLTGRDAPVAAFLAAEPMSGRFLDDLARLVINWLPAFVADHRRILSVAIGCTGGQHRSVYLAERLGERLADLHPTRVIHQGLKQ